MAENLRRETRYVQFRHPIVARSADSSRAPRSTRKALFGHRAAQICVLAEPECGVFPKGPDQDGAGARRKRNSGSAKMEEAAIARVRPICASFRWFAAALELF